MDKWLLCWGHTKLIQNMYMLYTPITFGFKQIYSFIYLFIYLFIFCLPFSLNYMTFIYLVDAQETKFIQLVKEISKQ